MSLKGNRECDLLELQDCFHRDKLEIDKKYAKLYCVDNEFVYISDFQRFFGFNYNYAQQLRAYLWHIGFIDEDNRSLYFGKKINL